MVHEYRDRIYIRKDILLKLYEHGEMNQSKLMSYCGMNNVKHKEILDSMVEKGMIDKNEQAWGSKIIRKYNISEKCICISFMNIIKIFLQVIQTNMTRILDLYCIKYISDYG